MRKRSKVRVPQVDLPWARVTVYNDELLNIFSKKTIYGKNDGSRRCLQTTLFNDMQKKDLFNVVHSSIFHNQATIQQIKFKAKPKYTMSKSKYERYKMSHKSKNWIRSNYRGQYLFRDQFRNNRINKSKPKNFCLLLGKGSTYNRKLFISRQAVRKLTRVGLLSGLQK